MFLDKAILGKTYIVKKIYIEDSDFVSFLFSLGCYSGEPITVISRQKNTCVMAIKDARYCIDKALQTSIEIE